jgi:hypothetical protein
MASPNSKRIVRGAVFGLALIGGATLGVTLGSAEGPYDDWGCPPERIAREIITPAEGGGYKTEAEALTAMAVYLARDGAQDRSEYAAAINSRTGPTRFDPETGQIYIDDMVEAQLQFQQLDDGSWAAAEVVICGPPVPPELASPYPTPVDDTES